VVASQPLVARATANKETLACLWLRALLPASWTAIAPPPSQAIPTVAFGSLGACDPRLALGPDDFCDVYSDASGGPHSADHRLRRVTTGFVVLQDAIPNRLHLLPEGVEDIHPAMGKAARATFDFFQDQLGYRAGFKVLFGAAGALAGPVQTVPRGELQAIIMVLELMPGHLNLRVYTDHENHVNKWAAGKAATQGSAHSDLWEVFWSLVDMRSGITTLLYTPAHRDQTLVHDIQQGRAPLDYFGNALADACASLLQAHAAVPSHLVQQVQSADALVWTIGRRLASIGLTASSGHRTRRTATGGRTKRPDIKVILANSTHDWELASGTYVCSACFLKARRSELRLKDTLACHIGLGESYDTSREAIFRAPMASSPEALALAQSRNIHPSHLVSRVMGTILCWTCGAYTTSNRQRDLNKPCDLHVTNDSKKNVIQRVSHGLGPTSGHKHNQEVHKRNAELRAQAKRHTGLPHRPGR